MIIRQRVLHDVQLKDVRRVRVLVVEESRTTVKATFTSYAYYIVCARRRAKISRQAAVALGVRV